MVFGSSYSFRPSPPAKVAVSRQDIRSRPPLPRWPGRRHRFIDLMFAILLSLLHHLPFHQLPRQRSYQAVALPRHTFIPPIEGGFTTADSSVLLSAILILFPFFLGQNSPALPERAGNPDYAPGEAGRSSTGPRRRFLDPGVGRRPLSGSETSTRTRPGYTEQADGSGFSISPCESFCRSCAY